MGKRWTLDWTFKVQFRVRLIKKLIPLFKIRFRTCFLTLTLLLSRFKIFHVKEKEVPVDTIEVKDMVTLFMWEPKGNRLCTLHGEPGRVACTLYNVVQRKVTPQITIPDLRSIDCIFWSPVGQYSVLAQL